MMFFIFMVLAFGCSIGELIANCTGHPAAVSEFRIGVLCFEVSGILSCLVED